MYKYILIGDGMMAMPIHSDMNWMEMRDYIREQSKPKSKRHHPCFVWGVIEFVNPEVMSADDYKNRLPALIGIK